MEVKIINKSHHPLPGYATPLSAGMDIRANLTEPVVLKPLERKLIPTGLYCAARSCWGTLYTAHTEQGRWYGFVTGLGAALSDIAMP